MARMYEERAETLNNYLVDSMAKLEIVAEPQRQQIVTITSEREQKEYK